MKIVHASPGFGTALTESQVIDFLSSSKLNLQLGTVDDTGKPNIHPVWYYYENERLYVETGKTSKKVQNVKANNNVYFCIDDERMPYKGVRGKATAKISEEINQILPFTEKICLKYTGSLDNEIAKFLLEGVKNGFSVILEISPKFYSTWDHSSGIIA